MGSSGSPVPGYVLHILSGQFDIRLVQPFHDPGYPCLADGFQPGKLPQEIFVSMVDAITE